MQPLHPENPGQSASSRSRQLIHIDLRAFNAKRVKDIAKSGNDLIQILGSSDQDCPACTLLDGQVFKITNVPALPPETCSCLPYCTCVVTLISNERQ